MNFRDLKDLAADCHDPRVRGLIEESIRAYHAGAFRATVILAWVSLIFDYVYKLEELGAKGDAPAQKEVTDFFQWQANADYVRLLKFENDMLDRAESQYQFISIVEKNELKRLQEDRHKCAHPSTNVSYEPYYPSAELARYHVSNVLRLMCIHPPTLGKYGLNEIYSLITSVSFPLDGRRAVEHLNASPLLRLRSAAQRDLVISLIKAPLKENLSDSSADRIYSALKAIYELQPALITVVMQEKLTMIFQTLTDSQRLQTFRLLFELPVLMSLLEKRELDRVAATIAFLNPTNQSKFIAYAASIDTFNEQTTPLIQKLPHSGLAELIRVQPNTTTIQLAIERWRMTQNYDESDLIMQTLILPFVTLFSDMQIQEILQIAGQDSQVYGAQKLMPGFFLEFFQSLQARQPDFQPQWRELYDRVLQTPRWSSLCSRLRDEFHFQ